MFFTCSPGTGKRRKQAVELQGVPRIGGTERYKDLQAIGKRQAGMKESIMIIDRIGGPTSHIMILSVYVSEGFVGKMNMILNVCFFARYGRLTDSLSPPNAFIKNIIRRDLPVGTSLDQQRIQDSVRVI